MQDNLLTVQDNSDTTKQMQLQLSGITTGTTRTLTIPDANGTVALLTDTGITLATEQASTSGTSIDFTGIPAGTKRITIMFVGVSTNGGSNLLIQLGDSGGIETSGYLGTGLRLTDSTAIVAVNSTVGFILPIGAATTTIHGTVVLTLENSSNFTWVANGSCGYSDTGGSVQTMGQKATSAELTQVRITTVNGTDAFDAGAINISYER